jgi:hypothetical protein
MGLIFSKQKKLIKFFLHVDMMLRTPWEKKFLVHLEIIKLFSIKVDFFFQIPQFLLPKWKFFLKKRKKNSSRRCPYNNNNN